MKEMLFTSKLILSTTTKLIKRYYRADLVKLTDQERINYLRKMAKPKCRENPIIMKLDTPEFNSIFNEELTRLISLFKEYDFEIRIAGGAVRDLLMGKEPKDLDFATTATPTQMKEMFTAEEIRMINANGEKHGTITPRINDKQNFEVTTLRIDVLTDGRHAEVQFTTDWMLDALRRDLTINSMFLGFDGSVYDYFYGYEDLKNHRVAFVGDATTRIQEDYLRILRYFRFYGRICKEPNKHEEVTLKAIRDNMPGLAGISGERIWTELKKILEGNYGGELMVTMIETGLPPYLGLPENFNLPELKRVWKESGHLPLNAITLLSSLLNTVDDVATLNSRLKLSAFERDLAIYIIENRGPKLHPKPLHPFRQQILKGFKPANIKKMAVEVLKYNNSVHWKELENWEIPKFPVSGNLLKERGVQSGKFLGVVMNELKLFWIENDCSLSVEQILEEVPRILDTLTEKKKKK